MQRRCSLELENRLFPLFKGKSKDAEDANDADDAKETDDVAWFSCYAY